MVRDATARVDGNRFEDVFYGIYLKNAPGSFIRDNLIEGNLATDKGGGIHPFTNDSIAGSIEITVTEDQAEIMQEALGTLQQAAIIGVFLGLGVLF